LSGVYLAMLTLAFAQIAWSIAFQWIDLTGGDNGIVGIWPPAWAASTSAFYYLAGAICVIGVLCLRHLAFSPFGYTLRAGRDSPLRADAIGIDVRQHRWLAFTVAGIFAGVAGGLFAYLKGSVSPGTMSIAQSIDGLVMVLLGGVQTLIGPILGGAVYSILKSELISLTNYWRSLLGIVIILLVVLFREGLAGGAARVRARGAGGAGASSSRCGGWRRPAGARTPCGPWTSIFAPANCWLCSAPMAPASLPASIS